MKYILILVAFILLGGVWFTYDSRTQTQPLTKKAIWHNASSDDILVAQPLPGATIAHAFTLAGEARGSWYFEASFPIEVLDKDGNQIFESFVQAQGDWMTSEFVPFSMQIIIPGSYTGPALLVLHRDNASGLPEHDKSVSIPISIE